MLPGNPNDTDDRNQCLILGDVLSLIGDKWTVMIVGSLSTGPKRFNELRRLIGGISQRILTMKLRLLEEEKIISRTVFPTTPPRVDYELTPYGETLIEPLRILSAWANKHRSLVHRSKDLENKPLEG
ncbi:winged helix-turn-helix transcriptional regulator [Paenibacillus amylolyticus]|uniref:winged helix-turn-helix transcriptional regulator n=1 Tax=Paenibacillus amylolyticus TaxID=1451 RepID=UPI003D96E798